MTTIPAGTTFTLYGYAPTAKGRVHGIATTYEKRAADAPATKLAEKMTGDVFRTIRDAAKWSERMNVAVAARIGVAS